MTATTGRFRTGGVVGLAVLAVGAVAAIAFAANPVKGAKYSGHPTGDPHDGHFQGLRVG